MRRNYLIFSIVCLFLLNFDVKALSPNLTLSCPDKVLMNNKFTCDVSILDLDDIIYGLKFNYDFNNNFSFERFDIVYEGYSTINDYDGFSIVYLDGINNKTLIGKLNLFPVSNLVTGKTYEINLENINFSNGTEDYYMDTKDTIEIIGESDIISNLKINGTSLDIKNGVNNYIIDLVHSNKLTIESELYEGYEFVENYGPRIIDNATEDEYLLKIKVNDSQILDIVLKLKNSNLGIENPSTAIMNNLFKVLSIFLLLAVISLIIYKKNYKVGR